MRSASNDDVFIDAPPSAVHRALLQAGAGAAWWDGAVIRADGTALVVRARVARIRPRTCFRATVGTVRPDEGFTWHVDGAEVRGTAEWWLEPFKAGTIVHHVFDAERAGWRRLATSVKRYRWAIRRGMLGLKDALEST